MDPPQPADPLNPWALSKKKKKTSAITAHFTKKTDAQVRKELEDADARALAVRADADARRFEVQRKFNLLVLKWKLPATPDLTRCPGAKGRHKVADVWVAGLYSLAEKVSKGEITEPSSVIVPPTGDRVDVNVWKPWRVPTTGLTVAKVIEYCARSHLHLLAPAKEQLALESAPPEEQLALETAPPEDRTDAASTTKNKQPWYKP